MSISLKNISLSSVLSLQEQIEVACKIPVDKQVLLASGGECLDSNAKVCTYSAGTDTNPIFLFSKCLDESPEPSVETPCVSDIGKHFFLHSKIGVLGYLLFFFHLHLTLAITAILIF